MCGRGAAALGALALLAACNQEAGYSDLFTPLGTPAPLITVSPIGAPAQGDPVQLFGAPASPEALSAEVAATLAAIPPAGEPAESGQPEELRPAGRGPAQLAPAPGDLAAYARATSNRPGDQVYPRPEGDSSTSARACSRYNSPDDAQRAFLVAGGPEADPLNLDPDGDGFACNWSPEPFRAAARAAN